MSTSRRNAGPKKTAVTSASPIALAQDDVDNAFNELEQHLQKLQAALGKEREAVDTDKLNKPGRGAHNFGQPITPLAGLHSKISKTMDDIYNWVNRCTSLGHITTGEGLGVPQLVLPLLFQRCSDSIKERHQHITSILFPKGAKTDTALLHDHMCHNHMELFFLAPGEECDQALLRILDDIRLSLLGPQCFEENSNYVDRIMTETGLDYVAHRYREILVHAILQQPSAATFSDDCGGHLEVKKKKNGRYQQWSSGTAKGPQPFDPDLHSEPVDCMGTRDGEKYIVVFPAMVVDGDRYTHSYTMPLGQRSAQPPASGAAQKQQRQPEEDNTIIMNVGDQLDVWANNMESLRTVGQLRALVDVINRMEKALSKDEVSNAFDFLGISQEQASSWADLHRLLQKAPDDERVIDAEQQAREPASNSWFKMMHHG